MQHADMVLVGSLKHSNLSINSTQQASKFSLIPAISPNQSLSVLPTSLPQQTTHEWGAGWNGGSEGGTRHGREIKSTVTKGQLEGSANAPFHGCKCFVKLLLFDI